MEWTGRWNNHLIACVYTYQINPMMFAFDRGLSTEGCGSHPGARVEKHWDPIVSCKLAVVHLYWWFYRGDNSPPQIKVGLLGCIESVLVPCQSSPEAEEMIHSLCWQPLAAVHICTRGTYVTCTRNHLKFAHDRNHLDYRKLPSPSGSTRAQSSEIAFKYK